MEGSRTAWRARAESVRGDIVLAGALTAAAISAASGLPPAEPMHAFLVLVVALVAASLAVRRLYPVAVLGIVSAATAFFELVYGGYWPFAALLAIYTCAAHCPRMRSIVAGSAALALLAVPIVAQTDLRPLTWNAIEHIVGNVAPLVAAWILGDNIRTRREYLNVVENRAAQLEREHEANTRRAAAEEQSRIAREVHDVVAHNLSVIIVQATGADAIFAADPADARRAVRSIGATARRALDELRLVLGVVSADDRSAGLAPQPGLERLADLIEQVRTAGVDVVLEIDGEQRELPTAVEVSAFRIVQEALTNTLRHSGGSHAIVRLGYDPGLLRIEVVDDGTRTPNGARGRGLIGMRERAAMFGGDVVAGPVETGGFRVAARLPVGATSA
jgi:signal transduction histidine kinase